MSAPARPAGGGAPPARRHRTPAAPPGRPCGSAWPDCAPTRGASRAPSSPSSSAWRSSPGPWSWATRCGPASARCSPTPTAARTPSSAAPTRSRPATGAGTRRPVPTGLIAAIRKVPGVAAAAPDIEGAGQLVAHDGTSLETKGPSVAGNWIADPELNPYRLVQGRAPSRPGEAVVNREAAENGHLKVGDHTLLRTPDPVKITIVGVVTFGGRSGEGQTTYTGLTGADAARYLMPEAGEADRHQGQGRPRHRAAGAHRPGRQGASRAVRGDHRHQGERRDRERDRRHLPERLHHAAGGVRGHRAAGGDLQHPQHLRDRGRPAHPGERAAAGARRDQPPGARPPRSRRPARWRWPPRSPGCSAASASRPASRRCSPRWASPSPRAAW